uniref:Rap1 GTPase-GDP dissociation stimulator 1 n=4 Tax=Emydidae TaxID=8476 RepID=A0A8C3HTT9_CHRPI
MYYTLTHNPIDTAAAGSETHTQSPAPASLSASPPRQQRRGWPGPGTRVAPSPAAAARTPRRQGRALAPGLPLLPASSSPPPSPGRRLLQPHRPRSPLLPRVPPRPLDRDAGSFPEQHPERCSPPGRNMDNLSDALKKLKITAIDSTADSLEGCLDCLLQALAQNNTETSEKIQKSGILQVFASLLTPQSSCTAKVANIIAEVAKNEFMRNSCVDAGLIPPLVQLLNCKDQEVLLQTGRALGNICYDSHEGRSAVDHAGGAQIVVDHLRSLCSKTDPANEKLLTVFCGMLMNYSNENDTLQSQLINMGVIPTLVKLLGIHCQNAALTEMCLVAFGNLAELESSKEQFAYTNIAEEIVKLFKKQIEHDKKEMIFEVLAPLAENDIIKLQLVEAGLVECLLEIVQKTVDSDKEDDIAELKTASDLMVLLLLGDESMQKLFEGGKGSVFQRVLSWIPSNNHQLQLAGALAIANFARNDGNCIHMVDNGIVQKLMDLLDRHVEDGNVTVQHAALSALRNLAIPVVNKAKMLSAGVAEAVLKFLRSEMPPVQFKLLGTLRMLIDAQAEAAEQLGKNVKLVERLVEWCEAKDHAGVMGESNRLLSALIRHSKSKDVIRTIVQSGGIKHLATMATSEHVIMQNEALVALALIAALELVTAEKDLENAKLVQILHRLLSDERSAPEIKYNSMVLICALMGSEPLHKEVQNLAFLEVVSKLRSHENKTVAQQASLTEQRLAVES